MKEARKNTDNAIKMLQDQQAGFKQLKDWLSQHARADQLVAMEEELERAIQKQKDHEKAMGL